MLAFRRDVRQFAELFFVSFGRTVRGLRQNVFDLRDGKIFNQKIFKGIPELFVFLAAAADDTGDQQDRRSPQFRTV